jgi:VIT1/CCC1 family predicted Fe2+/Mn2+ transporter
LKPETSFRSRHIEYLRPHPGPTPPKELPFGVKGKSGALRAAIFGVNDGLVSNLSLIMGFTGAAVSNRVVLLAGVAGLLAGAFSMAAGEYISMQNQRELFERLLHLEAHELATEPEEEHRELQEIYEKKGFPPNLAKEVTEVVMKDPVMALETHAREELGLDPEELGSPAGAAGSSFITFAVGAAVPLVPFILTSGTTAALISIAASGVALVVVGAGLSLLTGKSPWLSAVRQLFVGGVAAGVTFGVGRALHVGGGSLGV